MARPIFRNHYQAWGRGLQSPLVMIPGILLTPEGDGGGARPGRALPGGYFSWNRTVTVNMTGRGRPLMIIGS